MDEPQGQTHTVQDSILIHASPSRVFHALTNAEDLAQWWPKSAESDPRIGGTLIFHWFNSSKIETTFEAFIPDREVSFPFAAEHVRFHVKDQNGKSRVLVTHSHIRSGTREIAAVTHIAQNWAFLLCNLKCWIEKTWDLRPSRFD